MATYSCSLTIPVDEITIRDDHNRVASIQRVHFCYPPTREHATALLDWSLA